MHFTDTTKPYRITRKRWSTRHRNGAWLMVWQSEHPEFCRFARRGFTPSMAQRRMERDARIEQAGGRSLYQRWRRWRARAWDAEHLRNLND